MSKDTGVLPGLTAYVGVHLLASCHRTPTQPGVKRLKSRKITAVSLLAALIAAAVMGCSGGEKASPSTAAVIETPTDALIAALARCNEIYAEAFRSKDVGLLRKAFIGEALAHYESVLRTRISRSQGEDNRLLESEYLNVERTGESTATIRVKERWSHRVTGSGGGAPTEYMFTSTYEMVRVESAWYVSVNTYE